MANNLLQRAIVSTTNVLKRAGVLPVNFGTPYMNMWAGVGLQNHSNVVVNAETANKLSAFYSCVRNISEDIAKLPVRIYRTDAKGNKVELKTHPAYKLLNISPNSYSNPFTLKTCLIDRSLRKGDGFGLIIRDNNAKPIEILFLEYETVIPVFGDDHKMYYIVKDPILKLDDTYSSEDIFQYRGMGNAFRGMSVIRYAAESIGKAIATQDYAGKFYSSGANMTGLLKIVGAKSGDEAKLIKDSFMRSFQSDGVGALQGAAEFTKMNFSADEAQMLGSQEFNVKDIARWFRMPLSKLQTSDTISNIEALAIEYVTDCLMPGIVAFEQEVESKLFAESEKGVLECRIDTSELLRGDSASQERTQKTLFYTGQASIDELRAMNNMNTIGGDEGARRYLPVNMVPDDLVNDFWAAQDGKANGSLSAPDSTGSGNGSVKSKSKRLKQLTSEMIELAQIIDNNE